MISLRQENPCAFIAQPKKLTATYNYALYTEEAGKIAENRSDYTDEEATFLVTVPVRRQRVQTRSLFVDCPIAARTFCKFGF